MNIELIDRPKVLIAVLNEEFVGFARKSPDVAFEILQQEALRDAHESMHVEMTLDRAVEEMRQEDA